MRARLQCAECPSTVLLPRWWRAVTLLGLLTILLTFGAALAQSPTLPGTALVSAARTATQVSSADVVNKMWRGISVALNVSAYTSGSLTPKIQGKDPVSGNYYDLLTGAATSSATIQVITLYPGIAVASNVSASAALPGTFRIQVNGASTPVSTYSVSFTLLP